MLPVRQSMRTLLRILVVSAMRPSRGAYWMIRPVLGGKFW